MSKMASWSVLKLFIDTKILQRFKNKIPSVHNVKLSSKECPKTPHRTLALQPSRWQWHKCKDMFHYYLMVGLIPVGAIIFYTNVFIGPAQLKPIPKGYEPAHWEYFRHPITRFIARYIHSNPQQEYEKFMHYIDEEQQKVKLRALEKAVLRKMSERQDYKAYYYRPVYNKYLRINKRTGEEMYNRVGDDYDN